MRPEVFFLGIDTGKLTRNPHCSYDFSNKTVLFVGAGRRQLFDPAIQTKKLIAIDQDPRPRTQSKQGLSRSLPQRALQVLGSNFQDVFLPGEAVYSEFCLYEMDDPWQALLHAHTLAPDLVVLDHSLQSAWTFYAAEEKKVRSSVQAMQDFGIRKTGPRRQLFTVL